MIKSQLKDTQPLTKYYLLKLDLEKDKPVPTLEHFLHPQGFTSMSKRLIAATFCEYLTKCSRKELTFLFKNHEIRQYFTDAMYVIVLTLPEQRFTLEFALKNYAFLFQIMVNEEMQGQDSMTLFAGVIKICCSLPENQKDVFAYGIVAHLKKLVGMILERDESLKTTVEEALMKTNVTILNPEIIVGGK